MTLVIIGILSLVLLAHVLRVVLSDDPTRHRADGYRPPASHADDAFAAGAHHHDRAA